jgi:cobalamin-dependent methionine synthase I
MLGSGASGTVWAAKNELIDREVALKILHPDVATDSVQLQRFFNEAKASGRVRSPAIAEILDQGYRGSRYSFGYPACPRLEDRATLVELLEPGRIGVVLSEELQLHPEQSTDALVVHHPEASYFNAT